MPRITNVEQWSRIIKEKAVLRNLIHASNRIAQDAYQAEDEAAFILDRAEKAIFDIAEHRIRQGFVGIREIVKESFRTIDQLSRARSSSPACPPASSTSTRRRAACRRATSSSWPPVPRWGRRRSA
jgi:replicative DNA helicase